MAAPEVSAFGDGSHAPGATGLTIDGAGFGAFPGSVWIYANDDLSGAADELTVSTWNDLQIVVDVPSSLTNTAGARYVFVQREDLAWSNAFGFTLESTARAVSATTQALTLTGQQATVARARGVNAGTAALALAGQGAAVARDRAVAGQLQAIVFTGHQATVGRGSDRQVIAQTQALAFDELAATVDRGRGVSAAAAALAMQGQQATVSRDRQVLAQVAALTWAAPAATVFRGTLASIIGARAGVSVVSGYTASVRAA